MIDGIIKAEGNSRLLKSPATIPDNFADFRAALIAGTLPIDLLYNATGWEVEGTPLNKSNLISDETAGLFGLEGENATVNKALEFCAEELEVCMTDLLPLGSIVLWSGSIASIPERWALCDGNNGTPNLKDRFVIGAGNSYAVNATGGTSAHMLTTTEMPSHTHTQRGASNNTAGTYGLQGGTANANNNFGETVATGGGGAHNNMPPYFALAYIMRIS